ncbi:hypothetical protein HRI_000104000 [Hibiscus trionum]|uniref:Uncharacterized protein n=1 Tax=Hibiscus trionum TaxID=183268 RepID=A0A9W7GSP4_HIBTR|nr:hypothetical protein HRI_000104000 [Hibiscus trionum]
MPKPWQTLDSSHISFLSSMVFYVHSVILICQTLGLSYNSTLLASFISVPCCFFIISNCLQMDESFGNLYQNHLLFVAAHLSTVCDYNNTDLARGKLLLCIGVLFLSLYSIYIWCCPRKTSGSSEKNRFHLVMVATSFSCMANGIGLVGRWFIPRDSLPWLMVGAGAMFSIGVVFFCCYLFSSGKFKKT